MIFWTKLSLEIKLTLLSEYFLSEIKTFKTALLRK